MALEISEKKGIEEACEFIDRVFSAFRDLELPSPDKTIFDYFDSRKNWQIIDTRINELIEKEILPMLNKIDILVTVDLTGTTVMREKMNEYEELARPRKKILKSSYVHHYNYQGEKVAIFDDGICTGTHTIDVLKSIQKANVENILSFYYIAATEGGKLHLQDFVMKEWKKSIPVFSMATYKSAEGFNNIYGRQICSYMAHTLMPVDKDHFHVDCAVNGAKSAFDFWVISRNLSQRSFIVNTDLWDKNKLKMSIEFPEFSIERGYPCQHIKIKKKMLFKMRLFVNLYRNLLYLVPIVMDYEATPPSIPCELDNPMCLLKNKIKEENDKKTKDDLRMKKIVCLECGHMHSKLRFLRFFAEQFAPRLKEMDIQLTVIDAGWDKIESNYKIPFQDEVNNQIEEVTGGKTIMIDKTQRDHRFLYVPNIYS